MISRHKYNTATWIDLSNPTREEVNEISDEFSLHPYVKDELVSPSIKSRAELFDNYIYLILHFPAHRPSESSKRIIREIDFILGKDFVITVHYDQIDALDKFQKVLEVDTILDRGDKYESANFIFFGILEEVYGNIINELEYINNWVQTIEEAVFSGKEKEMVVTLSEASRALLNFKNSTDIHKEILESLAEVGKSIYGNDFSHHVRRILDEYYKMKHAIHSNMDSVIELRETNNSLVSTKQNEIMKTLTIMAFITFPLTLIASIFSLNTSYIPFVGSPVDFWIVMAIMVAATFCMFIFFKYRKWL